MPLFQDLCYYHVLKLFIRTKDIWYYRGNFPNKEHYEKYDGFVILHGTDTMAYTASALSFMCENLGKTVVLTGSQVKAFLQPPIEGIVLETYGSGNAPNSRADLLEELKKAAERKVVILNCTQCLRGSVKTVYATGQVRVVQ
ncbi:hypothetical protein llap_18826 [Limosa lapponica baueri]|uniref:L-asparaginase N-terminal domain-containing protein n=1 Tax=Limosa lapponica baueri TaxID=1758121 RepID=A0A2I0TAQ2_LIMLA|nr:hypothetical protein llap_18826 [Limosa lapponica baueri]